MTHKPEIAPASLQGMEERLAALTHEVRELRETIHHLLHQKALRPRLPFKLWLRHNLKVRLGLMPCLGQLSFPAPPRPLRVPRRYHRKPQLANPPVISIVTPSFNQGHFIAATIDSVLNQDYPRLEYVVQDGGSTDDTPTVLDRYRHRLHHCEIRQDRGQSHAINLGFAHTTGEIMAYLNSDDLLLPGALHAVAHYFERHPEVDVVYGHRVIIDQHGLERGRWVLPPHDSEALKWADFIPQETLFWRRRIWEKVGGIDESFRFAMDWDLLLRFQEAGARFYRLGRFLGCFRVHDSSKTVSSVNEVGLQEMDRLRRRSFGRPVAYPEINAHLRGYIWRHVLCNRLYTLGIFRY